MLKVNQLTRRYGSFVAVDNVSFEIDKGEIVGLLGHNGAGKTTIMKMLSGFLEPDNGEVNVDGTALADEPKIVQMGLGYLPENLPVYPEMSVADYLDYTAELKGLSGEKKRSEIKRAVLATDISVKLLAPIATLSRGYKQRVGVAQAILGRPKLLILDEPTNGLDPEQTHHMRQLIRDIAKEATVILSTHIMQEVDALCSRVLILRAGKLAVDEQMVELRRSNLLSLDTSMPAQKALSELKSIEGVLDIVVTESDTDLDSGCFSYRVNLQDNSDQRQIGAQLVKRIIASDEDVFRLQPEHRDLETLFREVNEQTEGLNNAA